MTTLNDCLDEYDFFENAPANYISKFNAKQALIKWLTQKQENMDVNWSGAANDYREDQYDAAQFYMITKLLEDLKDEK